MENIITTTGGAHVSGAPLTTDQTAAASPELLRNAIDSRITRIRPMSTPIDQISRCGGARHCSAMTVEYYSVDTKPTSTTTLVNTDLTELTDRGNEMKTFDLRVREFKIFEPSETILFPGVQLSPKTPTPLVGYIYDITSDGTLQVAPVGGEDALAELETLPAGTKVERMGRAATELDVQTPQYQALPRKAANNCQIFKMQVEQSTLQRLSDKEVPWGLTDQEEAAVIDMRLGMEKNFLFGTRAKFLDPRKNEYVYLTGGIWNQTDNTELYDPANFSESTLIDIASHAFTGNNGSKSKILIAGTGLIERLSKLHLDKARPAANTLVKWGVTFNEISTNFGKLYVVHSEIFDACEHRDDGMVIDPDYITKYSHIPFQIEKLDLRRSGQRNTDAVVLTEASCLVLRYPNAHLKIISV